MDYEVHQFKPHFVAVSKFEFKTTLPKIDDLDLNQIIVKSMHKNSGYGWEQELAEEVAVMYRAFLFLCKTYPEETIVPIKEVDEFWHLHILDTQKYHKDCQNIFGYYLHHFPYAGLAGTSVSRHEEEKFILRTLELIAVHFPELIEEN